MMKWLTKSDYMKYLIHPAYLWMQKRDKDKLPPFDAAAQAIVEQGNILEGYARELFGAGSTVVSLFQDSVRETERYVRDGATTIFQASVLTERRLYARSDVITRNDDDSWDLTEIKSATKVKPDYYHDLAFQKIALEESGYRIRRSFVVHVSSQYVRRGSIDTQQLFTKIEVTEEVDGLISRTRRGIEAALEVMALPQCPDDALAKATSYWGWRDIWRSLHPNLPADSVYNLCRLDLAQVRSLAKHEITGLKQLSEMGRRDELPDSLELKPAQYQQLEAVAKGAPVIHPIKIANELGKLRYPLYYFDYETVGGGLPLYDGTRPYQQIPFQYSLHIQHEPDGELEHREFLARSSASPMPALIKQLRADIGPEGSVIAWNMSFEKGVNSMMATIYPDDAEFLEDINARMRDLMDPFYKGYYSDDAFMGSASLKKVLPVIVPELRYSDLEIQEGGAAQRQWEQAAFGAVPAETAEQIYKNLLIYCGQDTLAMVKIHDFLKELSQIAPGAQISLF
jgi:hypothetical protein